MDGTRIPRLSDLLELVNKAGDTKVGFDCEAKVDPNERAATLPPGEFARRVIAEIRTMYLWSPRTLKPAGDGKPSPWLAGFGPELQGGSVPDAVKAAGGKIWAPNQTYLTPAMLAKAHALGIVVIAWTVNDPAMIAKLIDMGVDGIISDRPDLVQAERQRRK